MRKSIQLEQGASVTLETEKDMISLRVIDGWAGRAHCLSFTREQWSYLIAPETRSVTVPTTAA